MNRNCTRGCCRVTTALVRKSVGQLSPAQAETGADLRISRVDDETRTRDIHLGKVMLYQLSHVRMLRGQCRGAI